MNIKKVEKNIDYSKINIGTELECLVVKRNDFKTIQKHESQKVFFSLVKKFGWKINESNEKKEVLEVIKKMNGYNMGIKLDVTYTIFEIFNPVPVDSLETLEKLQSQTLLEFRSVLKDYDFLIWPFGVAPDSSRLLHPPHISIKEIINDRFYQTMNKFDYIFRLGNITSHQVNIDIPFSKLLPAMNAFFKNDGKIIEKFANSGVYANGIMYKEGRYFWWLDCLPQLKTRTWVHGQIPVFPEKEFQTWNDFYNWVFKGSLYVLRDGWPHIFRDDSTFTFHEFIKKRKGVIFDKDDNEIETTLIKDDIEFLFAQTWIDFKPHFDFDQSYTLEEFLDYYDKNNLDGFLDKYVKHCWLEIRPCSPHFEENAMVLPKYFYDIVLNLDKYIKDTKKISWEEAKIARDKAIGYGNKLK
jgi:hypothetical protein